MPEGPSVGRDVCFLSSHQQAVHTGNAPEANVKGSMPLCIDPCPSPVAAPNSRGSVGRLRHAQPSTEEVPASG